MFQPLFGPSPGYLMRMMVKYNNFPNCKSPAYWHMALDNS